MTTQRPFALAHALLAALLLLEVAACAAGPTTQHAEETRTIHVSLKDKAFTLEVASTQAQREQGLMDRKTLAQDGGMIFVFDQPDYWSFLMHDTNIALDLVYLDSAGKVVDIKPLKPHDETAVYPRDKAAFAIELNAGTCQDVGLTVGDKIALPAKLTASGGRKPASP
jgi:uncharacterized protein